MSGVDLIPSASSSRSPVMESTGVFSRVHDLWKSATKGTVVSSIFILLTTCMGAGTLSLPYAFSQGGMIVFSIIFFIIMLISLYVGTMLLAGKRYCTELYPNMEVSSYEDLAEASFGIIGRIASLLTIAVLLFLALIAYMIFARDQLTAVMQYIVGEDSGCTPLLSCGVIMCIAFIPILPVTFLRKLTPLQFTSYLSILSIVLVAVVITVRTIIAHVHDHTYLPVERSISIVPQSFRGVLTVITYCSLSFICHFNLLPLQKELSGPTSKAKLYAIVLGAILTAYFIYNLVVFGAYFNFYGCIQADVMLNYEINDKLITVARAFVFLSIVLHYPVLLHPTRANINGAVYLIYKAIKQRLRRGSSLSHLQSDRDEKHLLLNGTRDKKEEFKVPLIPWFLETLAIFCMTFIMATFIIDVDLVWNFVGSTAGVLVLYIYPSVFYLRLRYVRYKTRARTTRTSIRSQYDIFAVLKEVVAWVIFAIGLVLLVVENYQAIYSVVDGGSSGSTGSNSTCNVLSSGRCYALTCSEAYNISNSSSVPTSWYT